jgi:LacI family transcriptional regulator
MKKLTQYIIDCGHEKVAYIRGNKSWVTESRMQGFYDAMEANKITVREEYLLESYYRNPDDTERQVRQVLKLADKPTCIIVPDDLTVLGAMKAINEAGLKYPQDVSIAGYDGIQMAKVISPKITTIEQDCETLGKLAAAKLIEAIEHDGVIEERIYTIEGELLEGESVIRR